MNFDLKLIDFIWRNVILIPNGWIKRIKKGKKFNSIQLLKYHSFAKIDSLPTIHIEMFCFITDWFLANDIII